MLSVLLSTVGVMIFGTASYGLYKNRKTFDPVKHMKVSFIKADMAIKKIRNNGKTEYITPDLVDFVEENWGYRFEYKMKNGMSIKAFEAKKSFIETAFNGAAEIRGEGNRLYIDVFTGKVPTECSFNLDEIRDNTWRMILPCFLGISRKGKEYVDLTKAPHGIVGGETGGGKSTFIRQLLTAIAILRDPRQVRIHLFDLKFGLELSMFENLPHVETFVDDVYKVEEALKNINGELDKRGQLIKEKSRKKDIEAYNNSVPEEGKLPYHLIIVDELAEIEDTDSIQRIARLGRALGFHMILATQRPDAKVLEGQIKANCPMKVAFKVINSVNSKIILDNVKAAQIPKEYPGRSIVQFKTEREVQTPLLEEEIANKIIYKRIKELDEFYMQEVDPVVEGKGTPDTTEYC
ncbi:FtsK/SpoIIIE domain-containing protein [Evansella cellulosilytica]|uniref:Cell division protein FtsK/SpoIIIE n=1 Tax=Evansella cellulosilytica (strain ATCC 21833 / DSM 2522 / FERM P-1141 / JCM 9156 / N-4) TaxID=649639 RepID=E6TVE3_EVAC2|nr:FtsK/SpoIIIE domain-containing protein [Evansella cellulosilytica]ADU30960.1 cell division protein FtsK/SpoIIIE [Evansella cellulosilytica DSM 2522]